MHLTDSPLFWSGLAATLIPPLVAYATKLSASGGIKSLLAVVLSAITATLTVYIKDGGVVDWETLLLAFVTAVVSQRITYTQIWRQTRVLESLAPTKGIG